MKRLLLITAHFPPTNAVDMHRVRLSLPYYRRFGFEPEVLCFHPKCTEHPEDALLCESVSSDVPVHRVSCLSARWTRPFGLSAVGFRGLFALRAAGLGLIRQRRPDLMLFSTTAFPLMTLGPKFSRAAQAPYVLDFQDPWVSPQGSILKPTWKNRLMASLHARMEPPVVTDAHGLMAVSAGYLDVLNQRYPPTHNIPQAVIPFGSADADVKLIRQPGRVQALMNSLPASLSELREDLAKRTVAVYAGAYVSAMEPMVAKFFTALKAILSSQPDLADRFRACFIGSHYAKTRTDSPILQLAARHGVASVIREHPQRIGYYESLAIQHQCRFNLLFGSTAPWYNPSKLFTLLQLQRPVLSFVAPNTFLADLLADAGGNLAVHVRTEASGEPAMAVRHNLARAMGCGELAVAPLSTSFARQFSAAATTEQQAVLFDRVCEQWRNHRAGRLVESPVVAAAAQTGGRG